MNYIYCRALFLYPLFSMLTIKQARVILGKTGKFLSDKEIEKLLNNLYALIGRVIDNNLVDLCKKH